ncbi:MAG: hypothetical protein U9M92_00600 [Patescibacteria group bacterium]|nr:hypothetical protein [Patescibacteria group bacterium]
MLQEKEKRNPICTILWHDASYTFDEQLPKEIPLPSITSGFIISESAEFVNIATNVDYDEKTNTVSPVNGFLIPRKSIIEFKKVGYLNDQ